MDEAHVSQAARDRSEGGVLVLKGHGEEEVLRRRDPTDLVRGSLEGGAGLDRGLVILGGLRAYEDLAPALARGPELLTRDAPVVRLDAVAVALILVGETDGEAGGLRHVVVIEAEGPVQDIPLAADGVVEAVERIQEGRLAGGVGAEDRRHTPCLLLPRRAGARHQGLERAPGEIEGRLLGVAAVVRHGEVEQHESMLRGSASKWEEIS